jgi:hypothetical protein
MTLDGDGARRAPAGLWTKRPSGSVVESWWLFDEPDRVAGVEVAERDRLAGRTRQHADQVERRGIALMKIGMCS